MAKRVEEHNITELLELYVKGTPLEEKLKERKALELFKDSLEPAVFSSLRKITVFKGEIVVEVRSSVSAHHLQMCKDILIERVNSGFATEYIKSIKVKL